MSLLVFLCSAAAAAAAYSIFALVRRRRYFNDLPKPPHDSFWGHLKLFGEIMASLPAGIHYQIAITTIAQKYNLPGLWYLDLWPLAPSQLIITDPDLGLQVTLFENHPKHPAESEFMGPIIGKENVATTEGPVWKAAHNMLSPAFSASHVRNMIGMFAEEVMIFRSNLKKLASSGETFSLELLARHLYFDIVGQASFETSLGAQKGGSTLIQNFTQACDANIAATESWNPFTIYSARRRRDKMVHRMDSQLDSMVRERFDLLQREGKDVSKRRGLCIMDLILRDHVEEVRCTGKKALDPKLMEMAVTHVKTLLLAGTGTTTSTLCFTYMLLSIYPDVVRRLRVEHDTVFASGIDASYTILQQQPEKLRQLHYTTNVIKEVLRLYPIGNTARSQRSCGYITYNGKQYSTKGFMIAPMPHTMHMDPRIFPNPTAFDPDRFAREDSPRTAWRPFERGPRACMAQVFAMEVLKVTLLLTVRDFNFTCANLKPHKTQLVPWTNLDLFFGDRAFSRFSFGAEPRDGMPMTVKLV